MQKRAILLSTILILFIILLSGAGKPALAQTPITPTNPGEPEKTALQAARDRRLFGPTPPQAGTPTRLHNPGTRAPQAPGNVYDWSKLVYQVYTGNDYEIFISNGNAASPQQLTFNPANDIHARLNRGATRVVFSSNRDGDYEIYTMDSDGQNVRQLTFNHSSDLKPAWAPVGPWITYTSNETGQYEIYIIMDDGTNKHQLTFSPPGTYAIDPAWSPDGSTIAYATSDKDGLGTIWSINAFGGKSVPLLSYGYLLPGDVAYSPDGLYIGFDYDDDNYFIINGVFYLVSSGQSFGLSYPKLLDYEEHFFGGFSPDNRMWISTRVQYQRQGNYLVFRQATLVFRCVPFAYCPLGESESYGSLRDFYPDWQTADIQPPATEVNPLPKYSRQDGFKVDWQVLNYGPAPLTKFSLLYRLNNEAGWIDTLLNLSGYQQAWFDTTLYYQPGDLIHLYTRGVDEAGNAEQYPSATDEDTHTTLFTYKVAGPVIDPRGNSVPESSINISPSPVGQENHPGYYQVWLATRSLFGMTAQAAGYGTLPGVSRNPGSDLIQSFNLPPLNNLLNNGNFEAGNLTGWKVTPPVSPSSDLSVSANRDYRHTGAWGATLGSACPDPCLTPLELYPHLVSSGAFAPDLFTTRVAMLAEPDGRVDLLNWQAQGLIFTSRAPGGGWSQPVILDPMWASSDPPTYLKIAPNGDLLAVWLSSGHYDLAIKPAGQPWQAPIDLSNILKTWELMDVGIDQSGGLYLLRNRFSTFDSRYVLEYIYRTPGGIFEPAVPVGGSADLAALDVGPDNTLHIVWAGSSALLHRSFSPDGTPGPITGAGGISSDPNGYLLAKTGQAGVVYIFLQSAGKPVARVWYPDGTWSAIETGLRNVPKSAFVGSDGIQAAGPNGYFRWAPDMGWYTPPSAAADYLMLDVDAMGRLHLASLGGYQTSKQAAESSQVSLSQSVTLPANVHKPTLSFMTHWRGGAAQGGSSFDVTVTDGITQTSIFTGAISTTWTHTWVPLDDWAGKAITVTFTLHQAAGEPMAYLDLDDVSLGSWLTPLIDAVTPSEIHEPGATPVITITGENLIQTPQVFIGGVQVDSAGVIWTDANTLSFPLPPGLGPGYYDVKVANPGGQVAVKPRALLVGNLVYLPVIKK